MKSNYRIIGDFIKELKLKNEDGSIKRLLGVNLHKKFMPSVANLNGVDLTKYKVIKKGQFGCKLMSVGRDKKVPISRLTVYDEAIISSAYFVFEVIDEKELSPEYLMMWFTRSESDRFQWFQSGADIRGRITWEEFCCLPIRVPSIEKQKEIVNEYNTIVNRIKLNEQLNHKLEESIQAIYREWFEDFNFPNENEQPYKSSGGIMVYNNELERDIPKGWDYKFLSEFIFYQEGPGIRNWQFVDEGTNFLNIRCMKGLDVNLGICNKISNEEANEKYNHFLLKEKDIVVATSGDHGKLGKSLIIRSDHLPLCLNTSIIRFNVLNEKAVHGYIYCMLISPEFIRRLNGNATGTKQGNFGPTHLHKMKGLLPSKQIQLKYDIIISKIIDYRLLISLENKKLWSLSETLLSKIATA
jgi:type I restriction enzyme, S subunit